MCCVNVLQYIVGGACSAWIWDGKSHFGVDSREDQEIPKRSKRSPFCADLFGSVCYTFQHGKFRNDFGDLTRVDARLDICSASGFAKKVLNGFRSSTVDVSEHLLASPRLNLTFQQQVSPLHLNLSSNQELVVIAKILKIRPVIELKRNCFRFTSSTTIGWTNIYIYTQNIKNNKLHDCNGSPSKDHSHFFYIYIYILNLKHLFLYLVSFVIMAILWLI